MEKERRGIQSVEVGGALLAALADAEQSLSLSELAKAAAMPPAKAHPYLVSFCKIGLVEQDARTGRYDIGSLGLKLGLACLRRLNPVKTAVQAAADLARDLQQTVAIAVWGTGGPTIVHLEEASLPIHMNLRVGTLMALDTATGKVFAAYLPEHKLQQYAKDFALSPANVVGRRGASENLAEAVEEVRQRGLARAVGNPIPGVNAFSAPVFDKDGNVAVVMTALGSQGAFDSSWRGRNAQALLETARAVSRQLGYRGDIPKA